jgi:uncharacterized protein (DUF433 family)
MNWRDRISIDPRIHHGKPCIKGTRVPVSVIVGTIAEGYPPERVLQSWPQLTTEDVIAALKFASALAAEATVVPAYDEVDAE